MVTLWVQTEIHTELNRMGVEHFQKLLCFDHQSKLEKIPPSDNEVGVISLIYTYIFALTSHIVVKGDP